MKTYLGMIHALSERAGSERKASVLLGISPASFNAWMRGRAFPSDEQAQRLAELLKVDPVYVLALVHGARAKSKETRAAWQRVAEKFRDAAVVAAVAFGAASFGLPPPASASTLHIQNCDATGIHIVLQRLAIFSR